MTEQEIACAVWQQQIDGGYDASQILGLMASVLLGKVSGAGTGTEVFRDIADTRDRVTAKVDNCGNRLEILLNATPVDLPPWENYAGIDGAVFVTDIVPTISGTVGQKVRSADDTTLISAVTDTDEITVFILAITGHTNYMPVITVNEEPVALVADADKPLFRGSIALKLEDNETEIKAVHEDGANHTVILTRDQKPVITTAELSSVYPGLQTELKAGDLLSMTVTADQPIVAIEVEDSGAAQYSSVDTAAATTQNTTITIADRGTVSQDLSARVRVQKASGSWSDWYTTNTATLNNLHPGITISNITYPASQQAIKSAESATVNHSVSNYDTISYSSPTGELTIASQAYEPAKIVSRSSGGFNVTTNNMTISATRLANGATSSASCVVRIADTAPTLTISVPASRLRSGGSLGTLPQEHQITITASQPLLTAPTLAAPVGTWIGTGFTGSGTVWTRKLQIADTDNKGAFPFGAYAATNLAGVAAGTVTGATSYTVGGFIRRTMTVAAYPVRQAAIGTHVTDTGKLCCTNLSKGASGSLNFAYQSTTTEATDRYTILNGNEWYNCDGANASSNTAGTMKIELEEVV